MSHATLTAAALLLLTVAVGFAGDIVGVNEADSVPHRPEYELTDIAGMVRAQERETGAVELPQGVFYYDKTIKLGYKAGVVVRGQGMVLSHPNDEFNTWKRPRTMRGTHLIYVGPLVRPAWLVESSHAIKLSDLAITHNNGGDVVAYRTRADWRGNNHHVLEDVRLTGGRGVVCGGGESHFNSADISLNRVIFKRCGEGFTSLDSQNVNYTMTACQWLDCEKAIHVKQGGNFFLFGCAANGLRDCFWDIDRFGGNWNPYVVSGLKIDRTGSDFVPAYLDATDAPGSGLAMDLTGFGMTQKKGDADLDPVPLVRMPKGWARLRLNVRTYEIPRNAYWPEGIRDQDKMYDRTAELLDALQTLGGD